MCFLYRKQTFKCKSVFKLDKASYDINSINKKCDVIIHKIEGEKKERALVQIPFY